MQVLHPYDNTLIEPKAVDNGLGNEYTLRQWLSFRQCSRTPVVPSVPGNDKRLISSPPLIGVFKPEH